MRERVLLGLHALGQPRWSLLRLRAIDSGTLTLAIISGKETRTMTTLVSDGLNNKARVGW